MNAADLLSNRARLTPEREALYDVHSGKRYTYKQLNERANRCANLLRTRLGIRKGDRIAIYAQNCLAYIDLLYAALKIGAVLVPLNWRLTVAELIIIVSDAEPTVILVGPDYEDEFEAINRACTVPVVIGLEGAAPTGALAYEDELAQSPADEPPRPVGLDGEDACCILYTSGTTGRPKGALLPQRQILWNVINLPASWGLHELDVSPVFAPLFHAGGLFVYLTPLFYVGGKIVLFRSFDPDLTLDMIEHERCTVIAGVPTIYRMWLESPVFQEVSLEHVHYFSSGGAPLPVPLIEEWRRVKKVILRQGYGLTEVGPNCFSMTNEESLQKMGSIGKPIFHSRVRLVNEEGVDVPAGETGEMIISGPHVCLGYWRNEAATAAAIRDGWFFTGDMARMDGDGFYYIAGRKKEMIISGGENIYPAEVEAVFQNHPAVQEAALIGRPDPRWGEAGVIFVQLRPGQSLTAEALRDWCGRFLARYKIPREIIFVDELPHTPYGKVLKNELRGKYTQP